VSQIYSKVTPNGSGKCLNKKKQDYH